MPLLISLKVTLVATVITFVLGVPTAYGMANYRGQARNLIEGLLLLPLVLPPTVVGFGLLWLLGDRGPLASLNLNIVFTWWAAVITAVVVAFPLMYRSSRAAFGQIDAELLSVARTLGASEWTVFKRVAVPLASPGIVAGAILSFARALGEFGATLMLAGNIPGKTQTLPMAVYFAVEGGDFAQATRWSAVLGAIALISVIISDFLGQQAVRKTRKDKHLPSSATEPKAESPTINNWTEHPDQSQSSASTNLANLTIDITKRLPGFTLRIQCETKADLVGVLGASGAGKSLLLKCLAGIEKPDAGRIVLDTRVLFDAQQGINLPSRERAIALLFQNYALLPHLTVAENIAFGINPSRRSKLSTHQIVTAELRAVQLERFANHYPRELSGGQQQRIALARALASRPQLLLLRRTLFCFGYELAIAPQPAALQSPAHLPRQDPPSHPQLRRSLPHPRTARHRLRSIHPPSHPRPDIHPARTACDRPAHRPPQHLPPPNSRQPTSRHRMANATHPRPIPPSPIPHPSIHRHPPREYSSAQRKFV